MIDLNISFSDMQDKDVFKRLVKGDILSLRPCSHTIKAALEQDKLRGPCGKKELDNRERGG